MKLLSFWVVFLHVLLSLLYFLCLSFESSSRDNKRYDGEDDDDRKVEQFFYIIDFSFSFLSVFWTDDTSDF